MSVIIPTKNSSKTLNQCLESVKNQDYKNIEIIVVDNHSTDSTLEIANQYTNAIYTSGPERSAQINYGVKRSSGKYIYRVDSDFLLESGVIFEAVNEAESHNHAAILIHNTSDHTLSFWAKVRKFERDMYELDDLNVAVRFIRKDVFQEVGEFDDRLSFAEDYDLHNRIVGKYQIGRIKSKETHLGEYKSIKDIAKMYYYYGRYTYLFMKKNKSRGIRQLSPIRKGYLKHYEEFLKHPQLSIGFIVYQIIRYSSAIIGLSMSKFYRE